VRIIHGHQISEGRRPRMMSRLRRRYTIVSLPSRSRSARTIASRFRETGSIELFRHRASRIARIRQSTRKRCTSRTRLAKPWRKSLPAQSSYRTRKTASYKCSCFRCVRRAEFQIKPYITCGTVMPSTASVKRKNLANNKNSFHQHRDCGNRPVSVVIHPITC